MVISSVAVQYSLSEEVIQKRFGMDYKTNDWIFGVN
jgi:hypothetical protein